MIIDKFSVELTLMLRNDVVASSTFYQFIIRGILTESMCTF